MEKGVNSNKFVIAIDGTITKEKYTAKKQKILNQKIGSNRILRERELFFEPTVAWQILSKSAISARRELTEAQSAEANNPQHTIWLPELNDVRN